MTLYFLRHAQSLFNTGIDGFDSPLSKYGEESARKLKGNYTYVICSPLTRARQTLSLSQIKYQNLTVDPNCREWRNGSKCDYFENEGKLIYETEKEIDRRVKDFVKSLNMLIKSTDKNESILVISHACFLNRILKLGKYLGNCELYKVNRALCK